MTKKQKVICNKCGTELKKYGYLDGPDWWLYMDCEGHHFHDLLTVEWPGKENKKMNGKQLEKIGFIIIA